MRQPSDCCSLKGDCLEQVVKCDVLWVAPEGQTYDPRNIEVCEKVRIEPESVDAMYPFQLGFCNGCFLNPPNYVLVSGLSLQLCELLSNTWCLELSNKDPHDERSKHITQFIDVWREKNLGVSSRRDRSRSPAKAVNANDHVGLEEPGEIRNANAQCFMMETQFRTPGGQFAAACGLSVGDTILDHQDREVSVTWCQKHPKEKRLVVDFHCKLLTVTGSHRIVLPDGEIIPARQLEAKTHKVLKATSSKYVRLEKVTKRYAYVPAIELEFAGDATVATSMPTVLTKGADPSVPVRGMEGVECKDEVSADNAMDAEAVVGVAQPVSHESGNNDGSECADVAGELERWPSTDDAFEF